MLRLVLSLSLVCGACGACGVAEQPKWATTVAAYEVPLPTSSDKQRFLTLLKKQANASGFHVDAATEADLKAASEVSPQTFNAAVWRGKDEESIASAMDFEDRLGFVWILFSLGQDEDRSRRFREGLISAIKKDWPQTASLPIMPNGGIPLSDDLIRTRSGYIVKPAAASKYQVRDG